jgi:thiamine phosphate synthase YjbQ (UPF0047 family)
VDLTEGVRSIVPRSESQTGVATTTPVPAHTCAWRHRAVGVRAGRGRRARPGTWQQIVLLDVDDRTHDRVVSVPVLS